jgi:hypothetical protein
VADAAVQLQALDGRWVTLEAQGSPAVVPESLELTANRRGPDMCSFVVRRDPGQLHPDLLSWTPCKVEVGGVPVWAGRVKEPLGREGSDPLVAVRGEGWQYHLHDDQLERAYVHSRLTDWYDPRQRSLTPLTTYLASGKVENGDGAIVLGWENGAEITQGQAVGVTLDLRQPDAKRVVVGIEALNLGTARDLYLRGHDTDDGGTTTGTYEGTNINNPATGFHAVTFTTPRRYVTIFLWQTGASGVATADILARLTAIRVFRQTAYEAANASILTPSDVLKDVLPLCPLLDQGTDRIVATTQPMSDFAPLAPRTPGELAEAADDLLRQRLQVDIARKLVYEPLPTRPSLETGEGAEFEFTAQTSGEAGYNRCIVVGTIPDGAPLRLERSISQLSGVAGEVVSSPSFPNPSFATDASGWTVVDGTLTRDTATYHSTPASGRFVPAVGSPRLSSDASGTWRRGTSYRVTLALRYVVPGVDPVLLPGTLRLGSASDYSQVTVAPTSVFGLYSVVWQPKADTSAVSLALTASNGQWWVDSLLVEVVAPTLPDRRRFTRTKRLEVGQAITVEEATTIADTFLSLQLRTPFAGNLSVVGEGARRIKGGGALHPSELLLATDELVRLPHLTDPDTGAAGRSGRIATVTYRQAEEAAVCALDASREVFSALLRSYGVEA